MQPPINQINRMFVTAAMCAALSYGQGILASAEDLAMHFDEDEKGAAEYLEVCSEAEDLIKEDGKEPSADTCPSEWEVLGELEKSNKARWQAFVSAWTGIGGNLRVALFALIIGGISTALFETGVLARTAGKWVHAAAILPVGVAFGLVATLVVGDAAFSIRIVFYGAIGFVSSLFALQRPNTPWGAAVFGSIGCAVIQASMAGDTGSYLYRAYYGPLASVFTFVGDVTFAFTILAPLAWFMLKLWPTAHLQQNSDGTPNSGT